MSSRTILITGANGNLGIAIARTFLTESAVNFVWLGVRTRRDAAEKLAADFPGRARCIELEVTRPASWLGVVSQILAESKTLDVLVNNAGGHNDSLLGTMSLSQWQDVIAANLDSVFHGCQAVLSAMISQRHGRIVNVASLSALLAPAGQTNYAAAKAGVIALTQSLAKEVARMGITVNAICPGYIETDGLNSMGAEEKKSAQIRIPMRRFGKPEEVAAAVKFLACPEASYITGSILKVDGGIF